MVGAGVDAGSRELLLEIGGGILQGIFILLQFFFFYKGFYRLFE